MDRYEVTVKLHLPPPDFEVIEVTYVLKANSPEEAESFIRRRLRRGPYGYVPHAAWRIDVIEQRADTTPRP
jgi:hypothetical protein